MVWLLKLNFAVKNILTQNQEIQIYFQDLSTMLHLSLFVAINHLCLEAFQGMHVNVHTYTCEKWNSDSVWTVEQILVYQI